MQPKNYITRVVTSFKELTFPLRLNLVSTYLHTSTVEVRLVLPCLKISSFVFKLVRLNYVMMFSHYNHDTKVLSDIETYFLGMYLPNRVF